jgi:Spy/CpxP family protein refolding chaperone
MKKLIVSALTLTLLATSAYAERGNGGDRKGPPGGKERMAKMQEMLGLSEEQVLQMQEIRQSGGNRQDMRAVLTNDQKVIMDERRAEHQAKRAQHQGKGKPDQSQPALPESPPLDSENETN